MTGDGPTRRAVVAAGMMGLAAGAAYVAVPKPSASNRPPELETAIPSSFAGWTADNTVTPLLPDEGRQALISQLYDETLARTYRDAQGRAVMLVIAYGSRQTESLQAHDPAVCYAAQGFHVSTGGTRQLAGRYAPISVGRVYATLGARTEPILYWLSVSGEIANFGTALRWRQIKLGLAGIVPEGFLVRASLIGPDEDGSYDVLAGFMAAMLDALPADVRRRMAGV